MSRTHMALARRDRRVLRRYQADVIAHKRGAALQERYPHRRQFERAGPRWATTRPRIIRMANPSNEAFKSDKMTGSATK
jgi:hypothetical protein